MRQTQRLRVADGGTLEWLPQEAILYDGARATLETRVELARDARFFGIDAVCFGLPARRAPFARGSCRQTFELRRDGRPLLIERGLLRRAGRAVGTGALGARRRVRARVRGGGARARAPRRWTPCARWPRRRPTAIWAASPSSAPATAPCWWRVTSGRNAERARAFLHDDLAAGAPRPARARGGSTPRVGDLT